MGVSEYFNLIRENLGFLTVFAFVMPSAVKFVVLTTGEDALLFISVIGVAGAYITFEGITFDFDFFRFTLGETVLYWFVGMIYVIMNVIILLHIWQHSKGQKQRRELLTSAGLITSFSVVLSGLSLIPLPWVAAAAVYRALTVKPEMVVPFPPKDAEEGETPSELEVHHESVIFEHSQNDPSWQRRLPKFFVHGVAFSLLDLLFGMVWPILTGIVVVTGTLLDVTGLLIAVVFAYGSLFLGGGLINAWLSEKIWKIEWDYSIAILFLSGVILFVTTQVMVSPLSFIINTFLLDSIIGIAIVIVFRYTVAALFIGIVGLLISFNFKPKEKPTDLLSQIEKVVDTSVEEEDSTKEEWEN